MNQDMATADAQRSVQEIENDAQRRQALKKVLPAAGIGHFVEWFDFGLYGTLATVISATFFNSDNPQSALLSTFAVFAVGFIMRPIGGMFWGSRGDRHGRKNVLATVVILTSVSTFLIGVLPTYSQIGVWASVLLVLVRLLQGFAAGGESSGATSLLLEYAPSKHRGFVTSFIDVFGFLAFLAGAALGLLLTLTMGEDTLNSWGWRIPFWVALPLGLIGVYLRMKLEDTPEFRAAQEGGEVTDSPLRDSFKVAWKALLFCVGFVVVKAVGHWLLQTFMPSYLKTDLKYNQTQSFEVTVIGFLVIVVLVPFFGWLSDTVGRKPLMIGGCIGFVVLSYPTLMLMGSGHFWAAVAAMAILGAFMAAIDGAINAAMPELFPTNIRYGSMSISYNVAVSVFGGVTPYVATGLIAWTGNNYSPAFFIGAAALISMITIFLAPETAHRNLVARAGDQTQLTTAHNH
ncbi:MFS family major facilitator transporter, proline/betaine:cation symporter [Acidipropionibacterium acidipropionici ATCC 4875]|uniref:Putative proline/betaine transporter n=1 Tax=Acidipropionibacterium acidipropionici (strain ATCC 4875 / DSM 20272 / JCM 6432 / NBRC 12425 / NCIMB 8070 / 4) TaxID=1171373 RepID=K7RRU8_ACIA4|nr:MFS transporter [Acidipropionibacterium acidipropionici]AFV90764.1 MFS family major facilitator transporter, proline/betaine:cation symporter [Acidipropionibacterium acidipropionici ATCC 4875]